jgi:hypothetical protein
VRGDAAAVEAARAICAGIIAASGHAPLV